MRAPILVLAPTLFLGACAVSPTASDDSRTSTLWPNEVVQAMPSSIPDEAVQRDSDGCYSYRDPSTGGFVLIIGIDGRQMCDGRFPDPIAIAALANEMAAEIAAGNTDLGDVAPPQ